MAEKRPAPWFSLNSLFVGRRGRERASWELSDPSKLVNWVGPFGEGGWQECVVLLCQ